MTNVKDTIVLEVEIRELKEEIKDTRLRYQAIDLNYDRRVEELDNLKDKLKHITDFIDDLSLTDSETDILEEILKENET